MLSDDPRDQEAARLRYELARLRAKRSVRLALLASEGASPRRLWQTVRGTRTTPDLDVIPPRQVHPRATYPHLMVASDTQEPVFGTVCAHVRTVTPTEVARAGADLLVLRWHGGSAELVGLRQAAASVGTSTVAIVETSAAAETARQAACDLVVAVTSDGTHLPGAHLSLPPWVDAATDNPVGWDRGHPVVVIRDDDPVTHATETMRQLARGRPVASSRPGVLPPSVAGLLTNSAGAPTARERLRASRRILTSHEALQRFEAVLDALDVPRRPEPRISVLLATARPDRLDHALDQVARQDHPRLELVLLPHGPGFPDLTGRLAHLESRGIAVHVSPQPRARCLGDVLNAGLDVAGGDLVAKMDDDDHYGAGHLSDLVVALRYSGADAVGRWANEVHVEDEGVTIVQDADREERWAHHLPGATMLVQGDVLRQVRFRRVRAAVDTHLVREIHARGGSTYATHRYGFLRVRHGHGHTHADRDDRVGASEPRRGLDLDVLEL